MTQKERLLEMFEKRNRISNYELRSMQPPMFQFPVRIKELKEEGYNIEGEFDPQDKKKYWYIFTPAKKILTQDAVSVSHSTAPELFEFKRDPLNRKIAV